MSSLRQELDAAAADLVRVVEQVAGLAGRIYAAGRGIRRSDGQVRADVTWTAERVATLLKLRAAGLDWVAVAGRLGTTEGACRLRFHEVAQEIPILAGLIAEARAATRLMPAQQCLWCRAPFDGGSPHERVCRPLSEGGAS